MWAVSFAQRFGSTLNAHVHFHSWVIDGVFVAGANGQVQFAEAAALRPEDIAAVQQQVAATGAALVRPCQPSRCCRCAGHGELGSRRRLLAPAASLNAGKAGVSLHRNFAVASFSLDVSIRVEGPNRAGLKPLLRYCARPPFALERLEKMADDALI